MDSIPKSFVVRQLCPLTVKLTKPVLSNIMSCAYSLVTLDLKAGVVDQIKVFVANLVGNSKWIGQ